MRKKKKNKEIQYHHLVSAAKSILLTIKIDNPDNLYETDRGKDSMLFIGCISKLNLYGGRAPKDLRELLTFEHMHKLRKKWIDKHLFPYFNILFPELTKKKMWSIIINRRSECIKDMLKHEERNQNKDYPIDIMFLPNDVLGGDMADSKLMASSNGYDRLFPMNALKYRNFLLKHDIKHVPETVHVISSKENILKNYSREGQEITNWACLECTTPNDYNRYPDKDDSNNYTRLLRYNLYVANKCFKVFFVKGKIMVQRYPRPPYNHETQSYQLIIQDC